MEWTHGLGDVGLEGLVLLGGSGRALSGILDPTFKSLQLPPVQMPISKYYLCIREPRHLANVGNVHCTTLPLQQQQFSTTLLHPARCPYTFVLVKPKSKSSICTLEVQTVCPKTPAHSWSARLVGDVCYTFHNFLQRCGCPVAVPEPLREMFHWQGFE